MNKFYEKAQPIHLSAVTAHLVTAEAVKPPRLLIARDGDGDGPLRSSARASGRVTREAGEKPRCPAGRPDDRLAAASARLMHAKEEEEEEEI